MFRIAKPSEIISARRALLRRLKEGAQAVERAISTPGGLFASKAVYWRKGDKLWAHAEGPWEGRTGKRWAFAFGTDIGSPRTVLVPSIEINAPERFTSRIYSGRILVDEDSTLYLGHKGMLRGGRGGDVSLANFETLIQGFSKEPVQWPDQSEEDVFVVGAIDKPNFLKRLCLYVAEAERLRNLARRSQLTRALRNVSPGFKAGSSGKTLARGSEEHEVTRFHETVVNKLHAELRSRGIKGVNSPHTGMLPDLYTVRADGSMQFLFEIKTIASTYAWYTGIGQLMVYGTGQKEPPKPIFVCPAELQHPNFRSALKRTDIELLEFRTDNRRITFPRLDALLKGLRS